MCLFKSTKKQSAAISSPAPDLAQDPAPPPYSPQDSTQENASKKTPKMTQQEAFASLIEQSR
ncbi:hypothetical protein BGZ58_004228, partial [Dissophora ornata]